MTEERPSAPSMKPGSLSLPETVPGAPTPPSAKATASGTTFPSSFRLRRNLQGFESEPQQIAPLIMPTIHKRLDRWLMGIAIALLAIELIILISLGLLEFA